MSRGTRRPLGVLVTWKVLTQVTFVIIHCAYIYDSLLSYNVFISIKITELICHASTSHFISLPIHLSYVLFFIILIYLEKNHNILSISFLLTEKGSMHWYWRRKPLEIKSNYIKNYVKLRLCLHALSFWLPLKHLESECTFAFPQWNFRGFFDSN